MCNNMRAVQPRDESAPVDVKARAQSSDARRPENLTGAGGERVAGRGSMGVHASDGGRDRADEPAKAVEIEQSGENTCVGAISGAVVEGEWQIAAARGGRSSRRTAEGALDSRGDRERGPGEDIAIPLAGEGRGRPPLSSCPTGGRPHSRFHLLARPEAYVCMGLDAPLEGVTAFEASCAGEQRERGGGAERSTPCSVSDAHDLSRLVPAQAEAQTVRGAASGYGREGPSSAAPLSRGSTGKVDRGSRGEGDAPVEETSGCASCLSQGGATWKRRKRRKLVGSLEAHARFLQYCFRRTRAVRPGCWRPGGMVGLVWFRPVTRFACGSGASLAAEAEFEAQSALAARALAWYQNYCDLLRARRAGRTPTAIVGFCGQGGVSEGIRRARGACHGQDLRPQERYEARFGEGSFSQGDSTDPTVLRALKRRTGAFFSFHSPPCKLYSSSRFRGEATEPGLIDETRDCLEEVGEMHAMENVVGAKRALSRGACLLRGGFFGLHVDRPRLFETNFPVHVDGALRNPGNLLRSRSCTGFRRRWCRLDPFGRPELRECCRGNLWVVQGDRPLRCTLCECADAMGLDRDHMDYSGMAQAIPPVYAQFIFAQACMQQCVREFGVRAITFDEMLRRPEASRREMALWLRGAGAPSDEQGVVFASSMSAVDADPTMSAQEGEASPRGPEPSAIPRYEPLFHGPESDMPPPATESTVDASEWRELWYSWAGGYDVVHGSRAAHAEFSQIRRVEWLSDLAGEWKATGRNSLLVCSDRLTRRLAFDLARFSRDNVGSRFTVEARNASTEGRLRSAGFELVRRRVAGAPTYASQSQVASSSRALSWWCVGERAVACEPPVDYRAAEQEMDPLDRQGAVQEPKSAKAARSFVPIPWEPERWDIGLPAELDAAMARRGVGIYPRVELGHSEVPFYKWASSEGLMKSIAEADRALAVGAMEYVPAHRAPEVLESSTIHPWTIVDQGGGKWRLCHDYSVGTNRQVPTVSFSLPSVWDVLPSIKPSSCFAKYDIRDGFWHMPVADDSRKRLVVRHPGTGRLMWASRLPFGYLDSPRVFCGLTEALIGRLRRKAAGKGIHFYVFVDDCLVVGDNEELTREGMAMLEEEFAARGVQIAPHKRRGPCRCIEFLGLLICNMKGLRGVTLTEKRLRKMEAELDSWEGWRAEGGTSGADPRTLASLLGKLIFASQVVRGGRTYMQGMLAQFKGLIVDWRRGQVKWIRGGTSERIPLSPGFWRDIAWWRRHLGGRCLVPLSSESVPAEAAVTGTDASGWGTGQVLWLDGAREESRLEFTAAEKRRPINWRELLGILRICEVGGERLRGRTVLVETDNMAAYGAARKLSSKSEDMQELVRRLLEASEKYGFELKVTHTPGEKLDRPDQTSRGDAVEEPRARLSAALFERARVRAGGFSSMIGAEREHARPSRPAGKPASLWVHPTMSTVGSALRLVHEELRRSVSDGSTAMVVLPDDGEAAWDRLARGGLTLGRFEAGDPGLEMNVLGGWARRRFARPARVVLFPRAAGYGCRPLEITTRQGMEVVRLPVSGGRTRQTTRGEGYYDLASGGGLRLSILPGSFVYSLPSDLDKHGGLYQVQAPAAGVETSGPDDLVARYAEMYPSAAAWRRFGSEIPVWAVEAGSRLHAPRPSELWSVDHLVTPLGGSAGGRVARFAFDFREANREIARQGGEWRSDANGWEMVSPTESSTPDLAYSPFVSRPMSEELEEVAGELSRLHLSQSSVKSGPEGVVREPSWEVRGGGREGSVEPVTQPSPYGEIRCGGCDGQIALGSPMTSCGLSVCHPDAACVSTCKTREEARARVELEAQARPPVFYGVYSEELGASGVYTEWAEVSRLTDATEPACEGAVFGSFDSYAGAMDFVKARTRERSQPGAVGENAMPSFAYGSVTRQTQLAEKLAPARLSRIRGCIEGSCGHDHALDVSTACRGGCGRRLHVEMCADLGRGYAALGNFLCVDCRLVKVCASPGEATPELRRTLERTMVLELSQGRETTAAGYAEYTRLEDEYVSGMGQVLEGVETSGLRLPRHSAEAFKNFLTWLTLDRDRARSLDTVVRTAGAFLTKLSLVDVTKLPEVKAHLKELRTEIGIEHEPATAATPRMLKLCVEPGGIIDQRYRDPFIAAREKLQFVCEGVGGCRIGEVAGGGDSHGLLANKVAILSVPGGRGIDSLVVEAHLEHSKTGFSRYLDMAGVTHTSQVHVAQIVRDYWRLAGFRVVTSMQSGVQVMRPDFWVVRVSLLGLSETQLRRLCAYVEGSSSSTVKPYASSTARQAAVRHLGKSEDKKYINVACGSSLDADLERIRIELENFGYVASLIPGPLLLSTTGGRYSKITTMPLSINSTQAPTKELLTRAHQEANKDTNDPDPDLDLGQSDEPKWSTHSLRRLADSVARRYRELMGVLESQIDIYFGWQERVLRKAMQVHYEQLSLASRMALAKITGML